MLKRINAILAALILTFIHFSGALCAEKTPEQASNSTYAKVISIDERISNLESDLSVIKAKQTQVFEDQFSKLIQILFVMVGISVTFIIFLANTWIKDRVTSAHDAELEKTKSKLGMLVGTANLDVGANIYTTIGGHCIDLYKNFEEPALGGRHHELYKSYVSMAVRIAANAYLYASKLQTFIDSQPNDALTQLEKARYRKLIDVSLNNYVFYLSQRGTQKDKDLLIDLLPKLSKVAADKKVAGDKWWDYQETVIWAKLHMDRNTALICKLEINELMEIPNVSPDWRASVKERYALYNKTCAHEAEMIIL